MVSNIVAGNYMKTWAESSGKEEKSSKFQASKNYRIIEIDWRSELDVSLELGRLSLLRGDRFLQLREFVETLACFASQFLAV